MGTDEKAFAKVFSVRSRDHLVFLNEEYKNHSPKKWSLEQAIRSETSGAFQLALLYVDVLIVGLHEGVCCL